MTFFVAPSLRKNAADYSDPNPVEAEHVISQMRRNYPEKSIRWMSRCRWIGPVDVPMEAIDFEDEERWAASHQKDAVHRFARHIKAGTGHTHPVVMVKRPGVRKLMIVDGHHRTLAYRELGRPARAYIGFVDRVKGPWDETHSFQIHQGASPANKSDGAPDRAAGKWEFPGGHVEDGETPLQGAIREWQEETGLHLPAGRLTGRWTAPNGYQGFVITVPSEDDVPLSDRDGVWNPDDPHGDATEAIAWWEPEHLGGNPAVRDEILGTLGHVLPAITAKSAGRAASVYRQLSGDYPPEALSWVHEVEWSGPHAVPAADIDWSNRRKWRAWGQPKRVRHFVKKIKKAQKKNESIKPVVLIQRPGVPQRRIADGHHRSLAFLLRREPVWAWTAHARKASGPWDVIHDQQITPASEREPDGDREDREKLRAKIERRLSEAYEAARTVRKREMISKKEAGYRHATPGAKRRCATCVMFHRAESRCDLVRGRIEPEDVCDHWLSKDAVKSVLAHVPARLRTGVLAPKAVFKQQLGGPEGFIHGYICVRPPCGGPGDPDVGINDPGAVQQALMNLQMKAANHLKMGDFVQLPEPDGRQTFWRVQEKPIKDPATPGSLKLNLQEWGRDGMEIPFGRTLEISAQESEQVAQTRPSASYQPVQIDEQKGAVYHANGDHIGDVRQEEDGKWHAYHTGAPFGDSRTEVGRGFDSQKDAATAVGTYHNFRLLDDHAFRMPGHNQAWGDILAALNDYKNGRGKSDVGYWLNEALKEIKDPVLRSHVEHLRDAVANPADAPPPREQPPEGQTLEPFYREPPRPPTPIMPPGAVPGEPPEIAAMRQQRDRAIAAAHRAYEEGIAEPLADLRRDEQEMRDLHAQALKDAQQEVDAAAARRDAAFDRYKDAKRRADAAEAAFYRFEASLGGAEPSGEQRLALMNLAADRDAARSALADANAAYDQADLDYSDAVMSHGNAVAEAEMDFEANTKYTRRALINAEERLSAIRDATILRAIQIAHAAGVRDDYVLAEPSMALRARKLEDAIAAGAAEARAPDVEGAVGWTRIVDYKNGTRAVRKEASVADTKREYLASLVGNIVGAKAPVAVITRLDPDKDLGEVLMEYVPNAEVAGYKSRIERAAAAATREGRAIRIMDQLIGVMDRHDQNWMIDSNGIPHPIDHGYSFWTHTGRYLGDPLNIPEPVSRNAPYVVGVGDIPRAGDYLDTYGGMPWDISSGEINQWRKQMQALESEFRRLDMLREYRRMMEELDYWAKKALEVGR